MSALREKFGKRVYIGNKKYKRKMGSWETYYWCYENQEWDKLVEYCLNALKNEPENDGLLWQLGDAYLQRGDYQKALELGEYNYQIHPESPNAIQIIISALEKSRKPVENFPWKGSPEILQMEDAIDKVYDYMLHKKGRKKPALVWDLYTKFSYDKDILPGFSMERFEEKMRHDRRFDVDVSGEVFLAPPSRKDIVTQK